MNDTVSSRLWKVAADFGPVEALSQATDLLDQITALAEEFRDDGDDYMFDCGERLKQLLDPTYWSIRVVSEDPFIRIASHKAHGSTKAIADYVLSGRGDKDDEDREIEMFVRHARAVWNEDP